MIEQEKYSLTLQEQLQELEDLYAQCLADYMDREGLSRIWRRINELRARLGVEGHYAPARR